MQSDLRSVVEYRSTAAVTNEYPEAKGLERRTMLNSTSKTYRVVVFILRGAIHSLVERCHETRDFVRPEVWD